MSKKSLPDLFEAMYHGKYSFDDFLTGDIEKDFVVFTNIENHKERKIYKPNKKLKTYHSFLNLFLFDKMPVNVDSAFAYRKGVNVFDAVSAHSSSRHFFQTDILDFFGSISSAMVREVIERNDHLTPIENLPLYVDRIIELVSVNNRLPVGFSTSPVISNVCFYDFDRELSARCSQLGLIYTRYSDDIIISSAENERLVGIYELVINVMQSFFGKAFNLNQQKTKLTHIGRKIKILGMVILPNGKVSVDSNFRKNIETLLYLYSTDMTKFTSKVGGDLAGGMERLSGLLSYINTVDQDYLEKLRRRYGATIVDLFLHFSPK